MRAADELADGAMAADDGAEFADEPRGADDADNAADCGGGAGFAAEVDER